jgi:WD40 repeat protein
MTATPTWSNFLINSDAEFHATRCQTQVVRSQRKHDIICTTVLKPDTPDNKTIYLVCGTSTGFINIYVTSKILKPLSHAPLVSFSAHRGPIQKLDWIQRSGQLLLVSAGDEEGRGWDWELIENQVPKTITQTQTITISHVFQFQSEVQIGSRNSSAPRAETNAIIFHVCEMTT